MILKNIYILSIYITKHSNNPACLILKYKKEDNARSSYFFLGGGGGNGRKMRCTRVKSEFFNSLMLSVQYLKPIHVYHYFD